MSRCSRCNKTALDCCCSFTAKSLYDKQNNKRRIINGRCNSCYKTALDCTCRKY